MSADVQVEVRRTRGDIFSGILANTLRSPGALMWYVGGALIVAIIAMVANNDRTPHVIGVVGVIAFAAMLLLYSFIMLFCVLLAARTTWRSAGALDTIRYSFSEAGIGVEGATGHAVTYWSAWKAAFETKSLIVIRHQVNLVHILPKRGLAVDTLNRLRSVLKLYIKSARLGSIPREAVT